ncbi:MAG: HAD-IC family P-type ATPase [Methylocystis sp.]|uniref:HAD-IC family P-type ATPase n=1 Tax=Methylocystis sp. TaxID=1911079 RepID=UPI003D13135D
MDTTDRIQAFARLAATLAGIYVCSLLWAPFLSSLTLAVTLAILFAPAHELIEQRLKSSNLSAAVSVLIVAVIVVAPTFFVTERLISEAVNNADYMQRQLASSDWRRLIGKHPWTATLSQWIQNEIDPGAIVSRLTSWLTNAGAVFLRRSTAGVISVLITFYALFYLLRDRREAVAMVKALSPLSEAETDLIVTRVAETIYAIVYGTLAVAAIQGALAGLMFWWLDLPAPLLWGLVMGLLSIVPVLGAFIVWIPAAIVLALDGNWGKAIILAAWGGLIVGSVDNLLRPLLMGERLKIHAFMVFISLVGGLNLFGTPGMILGPVAMTVTIALLGLWRASDVEAEKATQGAPAERRTERPWHCVSRDEVLQRLGVSANGLSTQEASKLLAAHGPNVLLKQTKPLRPWAIFLAQFNSILIWILIAASVVSGFLGDAIDAVTILAIVFLNAIVGFYQEYSAEKSIAALMRMTAPQAKVWRDGAVTTVASAEVAPGDILELDAGDLVAADARLFDAVSLSCVEAALTGESEAVEKNAEVLAQAELPIGDRRNMVFMGTSVATGSGRAVVVATGMQTEFGSIATLLEEAGAAAETPLQQRLGAFGRILVWASLGIVSLLFGLGLWRGGDVLELFLTSVSLAVAAIPESLPAVVTAALSLGVMRMSRRRALIRRLASVETLGSANVICTDKTGTLTVGQMTVRRLLVAGRAYEVSGEGYGGDGDIRFEGRTIEPGRDAALTRLSEILVGCNNARFEQEDDTWRVIGDPTEGALLLAGRKAGAHRDALDRAQPKIFEIPFDSDRKLHSIVRRLPEGRRRVLTNGAPDVLLQRCSHILDASGVRRMTDVDREAIASQNREFADRALRVLGSAFRDLESTSSEERAPEAIEKDLVFVGLSGLYDPPRPEARDALAKCRSAGVRAVVITGDHPHTAKAIGRELGIDATGRILSGVEMDRLTDEDLETKVTDTTIYARVNAAHKLRIVRAWQANDAVVAMTGDGVNDAPAIKGADIGVAMGRSGTEVTKQASDMIITDDNFATIVAAIEEGRGIYENIRKTLLYLLACNSAELFVMAISIIIGLPAPLLPIHLLWINLITDGPPALCLAADRVDASVMNKRPRERNEEIADEEFLWTMFLVAVPTAVVSFVAYVYGLRYGNLELARTYAFMAMVFAQLFTSLSVRSRNPIWRESLFSNVALLVVIVLSISVQMSIQQSEFFAGLLKTARVPWEDAFRLLAFAFTSLVVLEFLKFLRSAAGEANDLKIIRASAISALAIVAVGGSWLYWSWWDAPGIRSVTERETRQSAPQSVTVEGLVSAESVARVTAPVSGAIEAIYCEAGAQVNAGQLCARIDSGPYRAAAASAQADLDAARKKYERSLARATRAKAALERRQALAQRNAAIRRKLDRYKNAYARAVAKSKSDEALVAKREAALRAAEVELDKTNIHSPVDGKIVALAGETGESAEASAAQPPLFVVALPEARIEARVTEKDVAEVEVGRPVSITIDSLPGRVFEGEVKTINPSPDAGADGKSYVVVVGAANPQALLAPLMKATVKIPIVHDKDARRAPDKPSRAVWSDCSACAPAAEANS